MILERLRPWPPGWSHLTPHGFNLIEADPPWRFEHYSQAGWDKSAEGQYETMATEEIQALPVGELADVNALLLLWARNPMLDVAIDTYRAWGFKFASFLHWEKVSRNGKPLMGTGHRVRNMGEICILATRGEPKHKPFKGNLEGVRRRHSEKPEEFYRHVEERCPLLTRRVMLFSRRSRAGWETTGNQRFLFDGEPAHAPNPVSSRTRRVSSRRGMAETMLQVRGRNSGVRGPADVHRPASGRPEGELPLLLPLESGM